MENDFCQNHLYHNYNMLITYFIKEVDYGSRMKSCLPRHLEGSNRAWHGPVCSLSLGLERALPLPARPALLHTLHPASGIKCFHLSGVPSGAFGSGFPMSADGWPQTQLVGSAPQPCSRVAAWVHRLSQQTPSVPSSHPRSPVSWAARASAGFAWTISRGPVPHPDTAPRLATTARHRNPVPGSGHNEDRQEDGVKGGEALLETHEPIILVNSLWAFSSGSSTHYYFLWWSHINSWGNGWVFRIPGFYYAPRVAHAHISTSSLPGAGMLGSPIRALLPGVLLHWDPQRGKGRKDLMLDFTQRHQDSALLSPDLQREQRTGRWPKVGASPRP